ncbi:MAG: SDR family oxidoreductase, partial [Mesorhizobium sp.]
MASDAALVEFDRHLATSALKLDGVVLMPPQPHSSADPMPEPEVWRTLFQTSFIGPLSLLKSAIGRMEPAPEAGRRCKVVIISGISSAQVLSHYATANVIRTAWLGEAKTLAFALGERGIHVNTLSLGGTLSP